jgi:hypothetical protein
MPKQGWEGLGELFADLWRELSPTVRYCLFGGMALGFGLGLYFIFRTSADETAANVGYIAARAEFRLLFAILCGLSVVGALLGTGLGVTLELLLGNRDGTDKKKPRGKGGKSNRR